MKQNAFVIFYHGGENKSTLSRPTVNPVAGHGAGDHYRCCCLQRFRTETARGACTPWYQYEETCVCGFQPKQFKRKMTSFVTIDQRSDFLMAGFYSTNKQTKNVSLYPYILIWTIQIHLILRP